MPHFPARRLQRIEYEKFSKIAPHFYTAESALWLGDTPPAFAFPFTPFDKAANLLGQEFELIIYDARNRLNLEALAVAAGTLKADGRLLLLVRDWENWMRQADQDSLRWSGENRAVKAVNFKRYFKEIEKIYFPAPPAEEENPHAVLNETPKNGKKLRATSSQQRIINEILQRQADLYFLTAKRGRGKSALAGLLANRLGQKIYLTAPNKSAVKILRRFARRDIEFIPPDELYRKIRQNGQAFQKHWLFVDEAAMIPIELLQGFCGSFAHILFATTIHSYEGTGRGFKLKFMQNIRRTSRSFELSEPLRWAKGDALERFIDQLLLTEAEDKLQPIEFTPDFSVKVGALQQAELIENRALLREFYGLLMLAHYRTSPIDLRRLFDAPKQRFWQATYRQSSLACAWAIEEGALKDEDLIEAIQRGTRRPKGNLGAQLICFQHALADACRLKSLRISRIAVRPQWRGLGIGRTLIGRITKDCRPDFDYLSVSFGYTPELAQFWRKCGFDLVYLGEHKEASSGCYTAVALHPLSEAGERLCRKAQRRFLRNIGLQDHPLSAQFALSPPDWRFTVHDLASLRNFAYFHLSFNAALPAIRRFIARYRLSELEALLSKKAGQTHKSWLALIKAETARCLRMRDQ